MRLVTGLVKDRLLGCMGQVLQQGVDRIGEVGDRASEITFNTTLTIINACNKY